MFTLLISFFLAALIGITGASIYGVENLWQHPWVEQATWAVIGAGIVSEAICALLSKNLCAHAKWLRILFCHSSSCNRFSGNSF